MPVIKKDIGGRDISFAPLKVGELRKLQSAELPAGSMEKIDFWLPYIQSSITRAGSMMPEFDEMDVDEAGRFFTQAIDAVIRASGGELPKPGEGLPASPVEAGTTSSAS